MKDSLRQAVALCLQSFTQFFNNENEIASD